jgi:hypothetical protein
MMPGRLILEVNGAIAASVPIKGTAAQIRAVVRRHAESIGIDVSAMTDAQVGTAVLDRVTRSVRDSSMAKQRTEKFAELAASIEAQLLADNDIYDPPP